MGALSALYIEQHGWWCSRTFMLARREDMIFAPAPVLLGVDMTADVLWNSSCDWFGQWEELVCVLVANNVLSRN
jgi:hypothetical protein